MTRRPLILAACLLLGAALNAAVAWTCVGWGPLLSSSVSSDFASGTAPLEGIAVPNSVPSPLTAVSIEHHLGCDYLWIDAADRAIGDPITVYGHAVRCEAGWPMRTVVMVIDRPQVASLTGRQLDW